MEVEYLAGLCRPDRADSASARSAGCSASWPANRYLQRPPPHRGCTQGSAHPRLTSWLFSRPASAQSPGPSRPCRTAAARSDSLSASAVGPESRTSPQRLSSTLQVMLLCTRSASRRPSCHDHQFRAIVVVLGLLRQASAHNNYRQRGDRLRLAIVHDAGRDDATWSDGYREHPALHQWRNHGTLASLPPGREADEHFMAGKFTGRNAMTCACSTITCQSCSTRGEPPDAQRKQVPLQVSFGLHAQRAARTAFMIGFRWTCRS